jgi:hypothetical protein
MLFVGAILCVLGDKLIEPYLHIRDVKELWDALEAKFDAARQRTVHYRAVQLLQYSWRSMWSRTSSDLQIMAKELELFKCVLLIFLQDALSLSSPPPCGGTLPLYWNIKDNNFLLRILLALWMLNIIWPWINEARWVKGIWDLIWKCI